MVANLGDGHSQTETILLKVGNPAKLYIPLPRRKRQLQKTLAPYFDLTIRQRLSHCDNDVELIATTNMEIASPAATFIKFKS
jgi:hypothetical protein